MAQQPFSNLFMFFCTSFLIIPSVPIFCFYLSYIVWFYPLYILFCYLIFSFNEMATDILDIPFISLNGSFVLHFIAESFLFLPSSELLSFKNIYIYEMFTSIFNYDIFLSFFFNFCGIVSTDHPFLKQLLLKTDFQV